MDLAPAPDQPDAAAAPGQALIPACRLLSRWLEVAIFKGRDGFKPGAESQRQRHQRTVQIKFRRRVILADHRDGRIEPLEQAQQRILHGKSNLGTRRCGEQRIARELDRIAKPLFPIDVKPLILERFLPPPKRLWIFTRCQGFVAEIAIFVSKPALFEAPQHQQGQGAVPQGFPVIGLER